MINLILNDYNKIIINNQIKHSKMSQWSKSGYEGPTTNGWEQGKGKFTFPNGVIYEGQFDKGEFHGDGTLIYPNGVSPFILTLFTSFHFKNDKLLKCLFQNLG